MAVDEIEEKQLLIVYILHELLPSLLRVVLQSEIHPRDIETEAKSNMYLYSKLRKEQRGELADAAKSESYEGLDVSVLYKLIRNCCRNLDLSRWGRNPGDNNLTVTDDIERIVDIRNTFCHNSINKLDIVPIISTLYSICTRFDIAFPGKEFSKTLTKKLLSARKGETSEETKGTRCNVVVCSNNRLASWNITCNKRWCFRLAQSVTGIPLYIFRCFSKLLRFLVAFVFTRIVDICASVPCSDNMSMSRSTTYHRGRTFKLAQFVKEVTFFVLKGLPIFLQSVGIYIFLLGLNIVLFASICPAACTQVEINAALNILISIYSIYATVIFIFIRRRMFVKMPYCIIICIYSYIIINWLTIPALKYMISCNKERDTLIFILLPCMISYSMQLSFLKTMTLIDGVFCIYVTIIHEIFWFSAIYHPWVPYSFFTVILLSFVTSVPLSLARKFFLSPYNVRLVKWT